MCLPDRDNDGGFTGGNMERPALQRLLNPLVVGEVVLIFAAPDRGVDAFVCTRSHYRGTY